MVVMDIQGKKFELDMLLGLVAGKLAC